MGTHMAILVGSGAAAEEVGIPRHRLLALLDAGRLPEPELRVPGRRLFTATDIERIKDALRQRAEMKAQEVAANGA